MTPGGLNLKESRKFAKNRENVPLHFRSTPKTQHRHLGLSRTWHPRPPSNWPFTVQVGQEEKSSDIQPTILNGPESAITCRSSSMVALQSNHSTCHANRAESLICGIKTGPSVSGPTIEIRSHQITAGSCLPGRICSAGGIRDTEIKLR